MTIQQLVRNLVLGSSLAALIAAPSARAIYADDDPTGSNDPTGSKTPKHTIKEIMKDHKKGGLIPKVLGGKASDEEKKKLLDLYISMFEAKPPKGSTESWQKFAGAGALAAAKVVVGRDGAIAELKKATNCAACHKQHKPK